jgi:hypothetical protein
MLLLMIRHARAVPVPASRVRRGLSLIDWPALQRLAG